MRAQIIPLPDSEHQCGYFEERTALMEQFFAPAYSPQFIDRLLALGYRHFGKYFFRPLCAACGGCVPLRVPVASYRHSTSAKRLKSRNRDLVVKMGPLTPGEDTFSLYKKHKLRFGNEEPESFRLYAKSFFDGAPSSSTLCLYDGPKLISVSHIDITDTALSAVYCYYDDAYPKRSLGTYSILLEIEMAAAKGLDYVYLGYYIEENRHMLYKKRFYPNEALLTEGQWTLFTDGKNTRLIEDKTKVRFTPVTRLF